MGSCDECGNEPRVDHHQMCSGDISFTKTEWGLLTSLLEELTEDASENAYWYLKAFRDSVNKRIQVTDGQ